MNKNFSNNVKNILLFSREEAGRLHNTTVGVEHILLGMIRDSNSKASAVIHRLGVNLKALKLDIDEELFKDGRYISENQMVIDKSVENLLRLSLLESMNLNSGQTDTEHLLLAMLKNKDSAAARILENHRLDYNKVYDFLLKEKGIDRPVHAPRMGAGFTEDEEDD
ncbi:MAG: ATP-dependent Clp protease ATP-binding subunit, partial [Dysgonamonadaceae bacterium]|nr:ATP-dependent Clp protease ATP-binding subunit [Dysgonamonadaceae bacterium]